MKSNSKETNRIKEPSKFAIKFANTVFVLGILFSVLISVYVVCKIYNKPENLTSTFYYSFLLFAIFTAILFVLGLRKLRDELKLNMSVLFIIVFISVYGIETYLEFYNIHQKSEQNPKEIAKQMGIPYDMRTTIKVLADLNNSGIKAYPNWFPNLIIKSNGLSTVKGRIFPLGGISNITTVLSNESGYYPVIETDEHGFNNPKGLYKKNKVDIVLTGDSFTEGFSVHSDENISSVLRESGFNTINFGKAGNSSLIELVVLKEYAEPLKPKVVLWLYCNNDLSGRTSESLMAELSSSFLRKYLNENNFSQNLASRQDEIDIVLINYVREAWNREIEKQREEKIIIHWTIKVFKFTNLRTRLNLVTTPTPTPTPTPIFKEIIQKAKQMVSTWEGKMYFVYLPSFNRYSTGIEDVNREFVLRTSTELEIPIIDIHREAFDLHPDPLSLFPFRMSGHYNAKGYRLIAETIGKRLKADGIIPLNS